MSFQKENNQQSTNLIQDLKEWTGESPKKPFKQDGSWESWGKNNIYRAKFIHNAQAVSVFNWKAQICKIFYLKGVDQKKIKAPLPPETINITQEFNTLGKSHRPHPYFTKKGIKPEGLNIRYDHNGNIVIPIYSPEGHIISWQTITQAGDKFFKPGCTLGKAHHFPIGALTNCIYICEGFATGVSIHNITEEHVLCAFSKGNLDDLVSHTFKKYPENQIILCLDNDGINTHKPKMQYDKNKDIMIICPSKEGDFNDHKDDPLEQAKLHSGNEDEAKMLIHTPFTEIEPKKPVSFYEKTLLHHEFNFLYGAGKIGKTRGILFLIKKALENTKNKCAILSTENDSQYMLSPLFKNLKCSDCFISLNNKIIKQFIGQNTTNIEKTDQFLFRLRTHLTLNREVNCLLIDPLPRFIDWNNETLATYMIDGLREIAGELKICIIGVRNEGKNRTYETSALYKGSSSIGDNTRQVLRGLKCHRKSTLGKEFKGEKAFVIYTELSSLYGESAHLFTLKIEKNGQHEIAVPVYKKQIMENIDTVKYFCSRESGQTLSNKIFHYLKHKPEKGCTLEDLYNEFGDLHEEKVIRNTVYRNFDNAKVAGTTYVQLKNNKCKQPRQNTVPPRQNTVPLKK